MIKADTNKRNQTYKIILQKNLWNFILRYVARVLNGTRTSAQKSRILYYVERIFNPRLL